MLQEKLPFEFSGKMARLLGQESVSSEVAAIFELVKNAFDADASEVKVSFSNFSSNSKESPTITIQDDGIGMSLKEMKKNWLVIGTFSKDKKQRSPKGRRVVGNKGIGRFATQRLAIKMSLTTLPQTTSEEISLSVNWSEYEKEDITFHDIKNTVETNPTRSDTENHGTKIILSELRDDWTKEKIIRLRQSIASIIVPQELVPTTKDRFDVIIDDPDFKTSVDKKVHSLLFENAPFKLTATLSTNQNVFWTHLFKTGKEILKERKDLSDEKLESGTKWKHFGKCKFTLYFYPGESKWEKWKNYYKKALKISRISDHLKDIHGVKIYRDNFLVRPYGEPGNDWLNLEKARVMSNLNIGNTQVIGFIEISADENPNILDTTTRERLVENTQFESMTKFVKECISVLNNYRVAANKKLKEEEKQVYYENVIESEIKYLDELLDELKGILPEDRSVIKKSLKNITKTFLDYKNENEEGYSESERTKRTYRNLASLGISSATASHEINNIMAVMQEIPISIINKTKKKTLDKKTIIDDSHEISEYITTIKKFLQFVRQFVSSVKDDYESDHAKERITVKPTLDKLLKNFSSIVADQGFEPKLHVYPPDLKIYINRADLYSVMINLLTNSLKAVNSLPIKTERKIKITVEKQTNSLKIIFSNNGPNIPERYIEKIFDLFVSKYKEGTGLGLPITREIVEEYGGTIETKINTEFEPGATFEIKIPLEELQK